MNQQQRPEVEETLPGIPWVESPRFEEHFRDADADVRALASSLRERGYGVFEFPEADFAATADRLIACLGPHYHQHGELINVWRSEWNWNPASELVGRIATNRKVIELLSRLFGRVAFPFQTLNFRIGSRKRSHSDAIHFSSAPERFMCGVWVALEDVREGSGPLFYHPGSHKLPILSGDQVGASPDQEGHGCSRFEDTWGAIAAAEGFERERFFAKRGQALIWLANLLHGGDEIRDPNATRHSQVTHYYFEGCRYWTPLLSDPMNGRIAWREPRSIEEQLRQQRAALQQG